MKKIIMTLFHTWASPSSSGVPMHFDYNFQNVPAAELKPLQIFSFPQDFDSYFSITIIVSIISTNKMKPGKGGAVLNS